MDQAKLDSEEYHRLLAEYRYRQRDKRNRQLRLKKIKAEKSAKQIELAREKFAQVPVTISKIHFEGVVRTRDDVFHLPEIRAIFANVENFKELITATKELMSKLVDLGCFEDITAKIDTDDSSDKSYQITFKLDEVGLWSKGIGLSNSTPLSNQSVRINPVLRIGLPNLFGRAEVIETEFGIPLSFLCKDTYFLRVAFLKPLFNLSSNISVMIENLKHPLGDPHEQSNEEKNFKVTASWSPVDYWNHSLTFMSSWRRLTVRDRYGSFSAIEECGHSLKTSLRHEMIVDTTDDDLLPMSGMYLNLKQEFSGFFGNVHFVKNELQAGLFAPLSDHVSVGIDGAIGHLSTPDTDLWTSRALPTNRINSLDRFEMGGPLKMRGFCHRGLGDYLGCNAFWATSAKLCFSLPFIRQSWFTDNIKAHLFFDVADDMTVGRTLGTKADDLRASYGAGFAVRIGSLGRAELNYAIPTLKRPGDRVVYGLQFGLGLDFL